MRVVIEARALSASMGVKTYVEQLLRRLPGQSGIDLTALYDSPAQPSTEAALSEVVVPLRHKWLLNWWMSQQVPATLRQLKPDVVHFTKAAVPRTIEWPTVVTIHDIIPLLLPVGQSWAARRYWPTALKHAAQASHHILTISECSRQDIVKYLGVRREKITVTPLSVDTEHFYPRVERYAKLAKPYILYVGTIAARKNLPTLVAAFGQIMKRVPHDLVLVGKDGPHAKAIHAAVAAAGIPTDRLRWLGEVTYADLPLIYSGADIFVWPSAYEGWGLPPQEAMACGVPVIVSDGGSLPEVVGQAGSIVPFNQTDLNKRLSDQEFRDNLAQEMLRIVQLSPQDRQIRIEQGLAQVKKFSWTAVVEATAQVYHQVYENRLAH